MQGIHKLAMFQYFVVQVRRHRHAGIAHFRNDLSPLHRLPLFHQHAAQMRIHRSISVAMIYFHFTPITALLLNRHDLPIGCGKHIGAHARNKISAGMFFQQFIKRMHPLAV